MLLHAVLLWLGRAHDLPAPKLLCAEQSAVGLHKLCLASTAMGVRAEGIECNLVQWGLELDAAGRPYRRVLRRVTAVPPKAQLVPQYG
jgi:hypothetical protein